MLNEAFYPPSFLNIHKLDESFFSHMMRLGIDLGEINQLLHVLPLKSREYVCTSDGKMTSNKNWSPNELAVAPCTVLQDLIVFEGERQRFKPIQEVFPQNSTVFMLNKGYYGCQATVTSSTVQSGRIKRMYTM